MNFIYKPLTDNEFILQQICATPGPDKITLCGALNYILPTTERNQIGNGNDIPKEIKEYDPFIIDQNDKIIYLDDFDYPASHDNFSKESVSFKLNSFAWKSAGSLCLCVENLTKDTIPVSIKIHGKFIIYIRKKIKRTHF